MQIHCTPPIEWTMDLHSHLLSGQWICTPTYCVDNGFAHLLNNVTAHKMCFVTQWPIKYDYLFCDFL